MHQSLRSDQPYRCSWQIRITSRAVNGSPVRPQFKGNSHTERLVNDGGRSCFARHTLQKANDYGVTRWRD
jgi:hypothetical protein